MRIKRKVRNYEFLLKIIVLVFAEIRRFVPRCVAPVYPAVRTRLRNKMASNQRSSNSLTLRLKSFMTRVKVIIRSNHTYQLYAIVVVKNTNSLRAGVAHTTY